jgi:hypothetical protein
MAEHKAINMIRTYLAFKFWRKILTNLSIIDNGTKHIIKGKLKNWTKKISLLIRHITYQNILVVFAYCHDYIYANYLPESFAELARIFTLPDLFD